MLLITKLSFIQEDDRRSERSHRLTEPGIVDEEGSEGDSSDADDFIVDDEGRPIREKRKKKHIFADSYVLFKKIYTF